MVFSAMPMEPCRKPVVTLTTRTLLGPLLRRLVEQPGKISTSIAAMSAPVNCDKSNFDFMMLCRVQTVLPSGNSIRKLQYRAPFAANKEPLMKKILIIEDDPVAGAVYQRFLQNNG